MRNETGEGAANTTEMQKENIRKYFCDSKVGKDFLMKTQKL